MKRKLLILCIAGAAALSLGGCGGKQAAKDAEGESTVSQGEASEETETKLEDGAETSEETRQAETETEKVSDRPDYVGIQDLDIEEYVTLNDYANMTIEVAKSEVTDDDIKGIIDGELMYATKGEVKTGDTVNIDYVGKKDGVAFAGGTASGYELEIGSGTFIDGFEDGLIGVSVGDTVDLNLTFPENYGSAELAGKDVVFTVTVNSILLNGGYDSLTDEDIKNYGMAYADKEELWAAGEKLANERAEAAYDASVRSSVLSNVLEQSTVNSIPEYLVEEEAQNYLNYMTELCQSVYDIDLEGYVTMYYGMEMDDFNSEVMDMSREAVKGYLVYEAIARAEGINVTQQEIEKRADEEAAEYGYSSGSELIDEVGFTTYRMYIVQGLVSDRLGELVKVEEKN